MITLRSERVNYVVNFELVASLATTWELLFAIRTILFTYNRRFEACISHYLPLTSRTRVFLWCNHLVFEPAVVAHCEWIVVLTTQDSRLNSLVGLTLTLFTLGRSFPKHNMYIIVISCNLIPEQYWADFTWSTWVQTRSQVSWESFGGPAKVSDCISPVSH